MAVDLPPHVSNLSNRIVDRGIDPADDPFALALGPALFVVSLLLPVGIDWQVQGTLGLMAWILVWLTTRAVRHEVVFLLPVLVISVIPLAPWRRVVSVYWDPLVLFIMGAVGITMGWKYWGLTRRVAIRSLLAMGTGLKRQVFAWFAVSTAFSAVIPDTVTAAMLVPIAATVLDYQGYETFEEIRTNRYPSLVLLAIGWGAAVGGSATPLGGGMDILTINLLSEHVGYSIPFYRWVYHLLPYVVLNLLLVGGYVHFAFDLEADVDRDVKTLYEDELQALGAVSREELLVGGAWLVAFLLVFLEPVYSEQLNRYAPWFNPILVFPVVFLLLFVFPAPSRGERTLLNAEALRDFPLPVLFIWPGAIALARILTYSGTVDLLGRVVGPYFGITLLGLLVLGGVTILVTNLTTNTATAAALVPLVIAIGAERGLPVAGIVYAVAGLLNISYAMPSANGCLAVVTGFGADTNVMMKHGTILCVLNLLLAAGYFWFAIHYVPGWTIP